MIMIIINYLLVLFVLFVLIVLIIQFINLGLLQFKFPFILTIVDFIRILKFVQITFQPINYHFIVLIFLKL